MSEQAYVFAATKENFPELVLGNSRKGPVQLGELVRIASDFRGGLPRRALMALLETLEPDDPRVRRYRQALFDH